LHESAPQTNPDVAKRTYDERAAFEEAKRNLGIVGDKEEEYNRGMAILGKAYSIAMTLILVYFLLDAYQIIVTAGRSVNIGSFLSYALPKVLSDAVLVVPFLWFVLDYTKGGYVNPRRLLMLYLLLCSLSGVLSFAGVFGLAQVLFPAFTALDPASHPAAASSMVSQALVGVITAGSAVLLFLLTRPAVGVVPSPAAIREQMQIIKDSMADDEEEPTREDVLRQLEKEEGPVKDSTEHLLRELSADYALSNDPVEKNRLLAEIQQVQRAQKTGVKPNFGGASGGSGKPHQEAHEGAEATAASTAPAELQEQDEFTFEDAYEESESELETSVQRLWERFANSEWGSDEWKERIWAVEYPVETHVEGVSLRGRIDAVFRTEDEDGERWVLVDWKSGSRPKMATMQSRRFQLGLYRIAFSRIMGVDPERISTVFVYLGGKGVAEVWNHQIRGGLPTEAQLAKVIREARKG